MSNWMKYDESKAYEDLSKDFTGAYKVKILKALAFQDDTLQNYGVTFHVNVLNPDGTPSTDTNGIEKSLPIKNILTRQGGKDQEYNIKLITRFMKLTGADIEVFKMLPYPEYDFDLKKMTEVLRSQFADFIGKEVGAFIQKVERYKNKAYEVETGIEVNPGKAIKMPKDSIEWRPDTQAKPKLEFVIREFYNADTMQTCKEMKEGLEATKIPEMVKTYKDMKPGVKNDSGKKESKPKRVID